jgi:diguanylate cyclase (GGDEF)-like protein
MTSNYSTSDAAVWLVALQNALLNGQAPDGWPKGGGDAEAWKKLVEELVETRRFILQLSEGDLSAAFAYEGQVASDLKALQANLNHLTIQVQQAQQAELDQRALAEALRDTTATLNSAMNLDDVFDRLLQNVKRVVPFDTIDILLINPDGAAIIARGDGYQHIAPQYAEQIYHLELPVANTPNLKLMFESGQPCLIDDLSRFEWVKTDTTDWARAHLGVPILVKGKTVGFLVLLSTTPGFFTPEHAARMQVFANQAAIAIEKARMFEQLNEMATIDSLTGIPNRRHFFNLAETELMRSARYNHPLSAMMMDIDFFKQINDSFGHSIGDQVLQEVVRRCVEVKRSQDLIGRYGGEEFAFILPETGLDSAMVVANRFRQVISRKPFTVGSEAVKVTVSIGVTGFKPEIPSARALLDQADQAMSIAKHSGRNQVTKLA